MISEEDLIEIMNKKFEVEDATRQKKLYLVLCHDEVRDTRLFATEKLPVIQRSWVLPRMVFSEAGQHVVSSTDSSLENFDKQ